MLKLTASSISIPLSRFLNRLFMLQKFPSSWKIGHVVPIHKKDKKDNPRNYRPITLLSSVSKICEKIIFDRLLDHINTNNLLYPLQSGYLKGHSTIDQLLTITDYIHQHLDQAKMVKGIFLDISGAFDTVPHNLLLLKLKAHGINGPLLNLIKSYLENRKVMIKIGNSLSSPTPDNFINLGVPQGSLLGPLFFLIYINDLPENIISKLFIYADDTSLYYPLKHDDIQNGITELQTDLNKISIWAQKWHMEFEPSKCRDITFHSARKRVPIIPSTFLGNKEIPRVQSHKHLGIILDESLNFKEHVNTLIGRYQKMVNPLKALSFKMPSKHLEKIHNTFMILH